MTVGEKRQESRPFTYSFQRSSLVATHVMPPRYSGDGGLGFDGAFEVHVVALLDPPGVQIATQPHLHQGRVC